MFVGREAVGGLHFEGTVEFGLERQRRQLRDYLELLAQAESPFVGWKDARRPVRWTRPLLSADVRYIGRDAGVLREAILEGVGLARGRADARKSAPPRVARRRQNP